MRPRSVVLLALALGAWPCCLAIAVAAAGEWHELPPIARNGFTPQSGAVYDPRDLAMVFVGPDRRRLWKLHLGDSPPRWEELEAVGGPTRLLLPGGWYEERPHYSTAVFDPVRRQVLVLTSQPYGLGLAYRLGLWALSVDAPRTWTELPSGFVEVRGTYSLVLDVTRSRLLLFGGGDNTPTNDTLVTNEVLAYNLASRTGWAPLAVSGPLPRPRGSHSAVFDPRGDRMIVHAGELLTGHPRWTVNHVLLDDTWELSFASGTPVWREITAGGVRPPAHRSHLAVLDPVHDRMLIHAGSAGAAGQGGATPAADLWSLSLGSAPTWTRHADHPAVRTNVLGVFDVEGARLLVHGGRSGDLTRYDLWEWRLEPDAWTNLLSTAEVMPSRSAHATLHDPARDEMLVVLGNHPDAWAHDLGRSTWRRMGELSLPIQPALLGFNLPNPAAALDAPRDRAVAFLGCLSQYFTCTARLQQLDLATGAWTEIPSAGDAPSAESNFSGAHDAAGQRLIVFGGASFDASYNRVLYDDAWALPLDGPPTWTRLAPSGPRPSPRMNAFLVPDPERQRLLLFGGFDGASHLGDLWSLSPDDSPAWTLLPTTNVPPGTVISVALDTRRDRLVTLSRVDCGYPCETLAVAALPVAGSQWEVLPQRLAPPSGLYPERAPIYDAARDRVVFLNGNELWSFDFDFDVPTPVALHFAGWRLVESSLAITWSSPDAGLAATVERRAPGEPWRAVATIRADGTGHLEWRDESPLAGVPVRYRLAIEGGATSGEVEIVVPERLGLVLRPIGAQPAGGAIRLEYSLPSGAPARLQLLDVGGRRLLERALGESRAGVIVIDAESLPGPGIYFARLVQGQATQVQRVAVLR